MSTSKSTSDKKSLNVVEDPVGGLEPLGPFARSRRVYVEEGDVRVPFREKTELLEQVLQAMVDVAEATGLRVMDPQRGEEATLTTASSVSDEYLRMARYAGEYGAVSEALGLSSYVRPTTEPDSSPFRWIMIFAVFAVAIYVGYRAMTLHRTDEPPRPVNGPPKIGGE